MTRFRLAIPVLLALAACQVTRGLDGMYHAAAGTSVMNCGSPIVVVPPVVKLRASYPTIENLGPVSGGDVRTAASQILTYRP